MVHRSNGLRHPRGLGTERSQDRSRLEARTGRIDRLLRGNRRHLGFGIGPGLHHSGVVEQGQEDQARVLRVAKRRPDARRDEPGVHGMAGQLEAARRRQERLERCVPGRARSDHLGERHDAFSVGRPRRAAVLENLRQRLRLGESRLGGCLRGGRAADTAR